MLTWRDHTHITSLFSTMFSNRKSPSRSLLSPYLLLVGGALARKRTLLLFSAGSNIALFFLPLFPPARPAVSFPMTDYNLI